MFKGFSKSQRYMLLVLALVNFFNYLDRQVIFPLFDHLKLEFGLSDFQLGLLGTVFMAVHALTSLPFGILADKFKRNWVIAGGVLFWSFATVASGMAGTFKSLLFNRSLVGIGEAAYAPAATAMISEAVPLRLRARAHGIFNTGMFIGATSGGIIGGLVAYYFNNWRLALFISAIPGLFLAILSWFLKDVRTSTKESRKLVDFGLLKNPAYFWLVLGGLFSTFATAGSIAWGIEFVTRYQGYNLKNASILLGSTLMVSGVVGVIAGSALADWYFKKVPWGRSSVVAWSLIGASPLMFLGLSSIAGHYTFIIFLFVGTALFSFYHGPSTAVMHDLLPEDLHATAFSMYMLIVHLFGSALAPAVIGKFSDHYGHNLRLALELSTIFVFLGGVCFLMVSHLIKKGDAKVFQQESEAMV